MDFLLLCTPSNTLQTKQIVYKKYQYEIYSDVINIFLTEFNVCNQIYKIDCSDSFNEQKWEKYV
jgi:hypothetical protein